MQPHVFLSSLRSLLRQISHSLSSSLFATLNKQVELLSWNDCEAVVQWNPDLRSPC